MRNRQKQGYVLALVLVVTLVLASVASLVAMNTVRNIQSNGGSFSEQQKQFHANSMAEEFFAHIKASEGDSFTVPETESDCEGYLVDQLDQFAADFASIQDNTGFTMTIGPTVHDSGSSQYSVTLSVSYTADGMPSRLLLTATVCVDAEFEEKADPDDDTKTIIEGTITSVDYSVFDRA